MSIFNLMRKACKIGALVLLLASSVPAKANDAGIVLTFDDQSISQWHNFFMSQPPEVKATFFASGWHTYRPDEVEMLRDLEGIGHEIACHTYDHSGVGETYGYDPNRVDEYINEQILPALNNMRNDGFNPVSFAYPFGEHNDVYDNAVKTYFPYIRGTYSNENQRLSGIDEIFHNRPKSYAYLDGERIDIVSNRTIDDIRGSLIRAKNNNEIVTLYAHRIVSISQQNAILDSVLQSIIDEAKIQGLKFYTFKEAYQVGNKGSVTTAVSGDNVQVSWTAIESDFIGIVPQEEDDWRVGMPKAEFTLQQSGQANISFPQAVNKQKYKAIFYKNGVKRFTSEPLVIFDNGTVPLAPPVILSPVGSVDREADGTVLLSWNAVKGASGYNYSGYATDANGIINYSQVILDKNISSESANCLQGGVCTVVENISPALTSGVWKIRSQWVGDKGDYTDKTYFTITGSGGGGNDTTPPVITLLGNNPVTVVLNSTYVDAGVTATDNIDGSLTANVDASQVNTSQVGDYTVSYSATDAAGNSSTATRLVQVRETAALVIPSIISPKGPTQSIGGVVILSWGAVSGATDYDLTGYALTASGNIDYSTVLVDKNVSVLDAGCTSSDVCSIQELISASSGVWKIRANSANSRTDYSDKTFFTISGSGGGGTDTTPPVITLLGSNPVTVALNSTYTDAGVTVTDNIDGSLTANVDSSQVDVSQVGDYTVTYTATDAAGNTSTTTRLVQVRDAMALVAPSIISPKGLTQITGQTVTLSWGAVSGATSYDLTGYTVNASGSIDYSTVLFDGNVSPTAAGCSNDNVCSIQEGVNVSSGVWKIRSNSDSTKSDYSDKTFFTLYSPP